MKLFPRGECFKVACNVYSLHSETIRNLVIAYRALQNAGVDLRIVNLVLRELRIDLADFHNRTTHPIVLSWKNADLSDLQKFYRKGK